VGSSQTWGLPNLGITQSRTGRDDDDDDDDDECRYNRHGDGDHAPSAELHLTAVDAAA